MKKYTKKELAEIIEKHGKWLRNEDGGERADLSSANLLYADLSSANLSYADMRYANLRYANLSSANLLYADLSYADMRYADMRGAIGNTKNIKSIQCDLWPVSYTDTTLNVGCQTHTISEWWAFSDDEIARMDSTALAWWAIWKPILQKIIEVSPAVPTGYVEEAK